MYTYDPGEGYFCFRTELRSECDVDLKAWSVQLAADLRAARSARAVGVNPACLTFVYCLSRLQSCGMQVLQAIACTLPPPFRIGVLQRWVIAALQVHALGRGGQLVTKARGRKGA